jgi:hypothetical protein
MFSKACVAFLGLILLTCTGFAKSPIDFTDYDVPVYQQIVKRIQSHILERLGDGRNTRDRYFIIPFAYENDENDPAYSHSFMTVVRVLADNKQGKLTKGRGLAAGKYQNREFEAFNISWLPHDFDTNPDLCVFQGFGARLFPGANKCPISVGKNFNLETTIKLGVGVKNAIGMWGPYEIAKPGFDLGIKRKELLDSGRIKYRADDRELRKKLIAINCFHAMAGLNELYPNGGLFGTGFMMWGLNGTRRVLIEYESVANFRKVLLEPVDPKKDLYGFVYAPERGSRRVYNPFPNSSAYHR